MGEFKYDKPKEYPHGYWVGYNGDIWPLTEKGYIGKYGELEGGICVALAFVTALLIFCGLLWLVG